MAFNREVISRSVPSFGVAVSEARRSPPPSPAAAILLAFKEKFSTVTIDVVSEDRTVDLVYENSKMGVKYGRAEGQEIDHLAPWHYAVIWSPRRRFSPKVGPVGSLERLAEIDVNTWRMCFRLAIRCYSNVTARRSRRAYEPH